MSSRFLVPKPIYHTECEYLRLCYKLLVSEDRALLDLTSNVL